MTSPVKKLFGQTAVYGMSSILGRLLNYLLVPLYTAVFVDPADYGVVSELYAWVAFLIVLLTFGMETAFFRFIQKEGQREKTFATALVSLLFVNAVFFIILAIFHQDIARLLLFEHHGEYILLLGGIVAIDAISSLPLAKLRAEERAVRFSIIQFSSIGINIALNLVLMLGFVDPEHPEKGIFYILLANLMASLIKPILMYKSFQLKASFDRALMHKMLRYSIPLAIAGFAGIINEMLDRILLKQLLFDPTSPESLNLAEAQVGIYSASYKLAMLVTIFLQAYRYAAEPFFFNQMKNEHRTQVYVKVMNAFIGLVCCVFLLVSLNIDVFKHFIQNESYWVGLKVVPILLLANVFLGIYYNQSIWYKLSGKTGYGALIAICGALLTITLNMIYIPQYGYIACAWATLIVYFIQMILSYILGQRHYPIPYNLKKFFLYLGITLGIYFFAREFQFEDQVINLVYRNSLLLMLILFLFWNEKKPLAELEV
ncbi:MAG: oligosaccharide flippase family protein [Crocinitomicaceae bacterium]|nr:oligosaccharide flippase family protein [Crocinitomicaceae bacterium]MDG2505305.1 oligosaccharide flippase family protein [Crocinitomicaceae bacterium]